MLKNIYASHFDIERRENRDKNDNEKLFSLNDFHKNINASNIIHFKYLNQLINVDIKFFFLIHLIFFRELCDFN